jgi:hypothetical protein
VTEKNSVHDHLFILPKIIITGVRSDHNWALHGIVPQGAMITLKHTLNLVFALLDVIHASAPVWENRCPLGRLFMDSL